MVTMRTRVKICGITRPEDAAVVVASGADALGLVFYPPSPRCVSTATARGIAMAVAPFVTVTGLFVNATRGRDTRGACASAAGSVAISRTGDQF